jgi:hypothetical protein
LLFWLSGGVYGSVAYQMIVESFDTYPVYECYKIEIDPTFFNVDNVPEDTYKLDEIN